MKMSELLSNYDLDLKISSSALTYRADLYWKDKYVELKRGSCVGSLYGKGDTIDEAINNLTDAIMQTHIIKVNKDTQEDSYYINIDNLYQ